MIVWLGRQRLAARRGGHVALVRANARFWPTVLPDVRRELRRWDRRAQAIPDAVLRAQALAKLRARALQHRGRGDARDARPPGAPPRRDRGDRRARGDVRLPRRAHRAAAPRTRSPTGASSTAPSPTPSRPPARSSTTTATIRTRDDGGYLAALAATCRRALWSLPAAPAVAPVAQRRRWPAAARRRRARTRSPGWGPGQLRGVGGRAAGGRRCCAGRRSPPAPPRRCSPRHALIALAADPATTTADAERRRRRLPDDVRADDAARQPDRRARPTRSPAATPYLAYYDDDAEAAERLGAARARRGRRRRSSCRAPRIT